MYDVIIVGSGFAGSVLAERFATDLNKKVLVIEKRDHIGGNMFDFVDKVGVLQHKYGPHIFHTNHDEVVKYLSQFTEWFSYEHEVLGYVQNQFVSIPFNMEGIRACFPQEKAEEMIELLLAKYGEETKVPILKLLEEENQLLKELADFIYENVFLHYTMKQWDLKPNEIDPNVTNRVPVNVSLDKRYFNDSFQLMPKNGYTAIFERLLHNDKIELLLETDAMSLLRLEQETGNMYFKGELFQGILIYTGEIDSLFSHQLGELDYRSLEFDVQYKEGTFQQVATVNYPTPEKQHPYTRITEYKHMMLEKPKDTSICIEYSLPYKRNAEKGNIPYYPVFTEMGQKKYQDYVELSNKFEKLYLVGRLAEYRYYNMDVIVQRALEVFQEIKEKL